MSGIIPKSNMMFKRKVTIFAALLFMAAMPVMAELPPSGPPPPPPPTTDWQAEAKRLEAEARFFYEKAVMFRGASIGGSVLVLGLTVTVIVLGVSKKKLRAAKDAEIQNLRSMLAARNNAGPAVNNAVPQAQLPALCPKCGAAIPAVNINRSTGIVFCAACGEMHKAG